MLPKTCQEESAEARNSVCVVTTRSGPSRENNPARAVWEFVRRLYLARYAENYGPSKGARAEGLDPQLLLSLSIYSDSRGVNSARAIERLCEQDPTH